jgi:uncharacterized protein
MIDLDGEWLEEVKTILRRFVPECEVRVFGSRVNGRAQRFSDLDIALLGPGKLDFSTLEKLKDAFAESDLPVQVDVHDWHALSADFKKRIESRYENIHL